MFSRRLFWTVLNIYLIPEGGANVDIEGAEGVGHIDGVLQGHVDRSRTNAF